MRLLIVRLSAFGDVVHALPLAENARRAGATVAWLTERSYEPLLSGNPNLDRVFLADTRIWRRSPFSVATRRAFSRLAAGVSEFRPDAVIDAQGNWKSALLSRLGRASVVGFSRRDRREGSSALLCDRLVRPGPRARHVVDRNLALLEPLGIPAPRRAPDARYLLERFNEPARVFVDSVPRPFAIYHPGSSRPDKVWGESRLAGVATRLRRERGLHPVVSWGPGDEDRAARMAALLPGARRIPPLDSRGSRRSRAGRSRLRRGHRPAPPRRRARRPDPRSLRTDRPGAQRPLPRDGDALRDGHERGGGRGPRRRDPGRGRADVAVTAERSPPPRAESG